MHAPALELVRQTGIATCPLKQPEQLYTYSRDVLWLQHVPVPMLYSYLAYVIIQASAGLHCDTQSGTCSRVRTVCIAGYSQQILLRSQTLLSPPLIGYSQL